MRLVRLDIHTLPGIAPGFALEDLAPGMNLVTGPNAVGKSSLVRALRYLLAEVSPTDPGVTLAAILEDDRGVWTVQRDGRQVTWTHDGSACEPPVLPDRDQLGCYWLSMEDLLDAGGDGDRRIVEELQVALAGGFDLPALREGPILRDGSRVGHHEARELQQRSRALREVEAGYADLRRDEATLPELDVRIEAAREAGARAERLERALVFLEVRSRRREIEAALATFPEGMDRLRGDEIERLETLDDRHAALAAERDTARRTMADAAAELETTGLGGERPSPEALEAERRRLTEARRKLDQLDGRRAQREQAAARESQARIHLGNLGDLGERGGLGAEVPRLEPAHVSEAEALARELAMKRREADELRARIAEAPEAPSEGEAARHARAAEDLRAWLAAEAAGDGQRGSATWLALAGGLVALAAGAWASAWLAVIGGVLALAGGIWTLIGARDRSAEARRRFETTGLDAPSAWSRDAVRSRLEVIGSEHVRMVRTLERIHEVEGDRRRLERVQRELDHRESERAALAERLGFDPALTAQGLDRFVRLVGDYQAAAAARGEQDRAIGRLEEEVGDLLGRVQAFLARWGAPTDATPEGLGSALEGLVQRCRAAEDLQRKVREASEAAQRRDRELAELVEQRAELFRAAGLAPDARGELEERLGRLADWKARNEDLRAVAAREAERREALADAPELLDAVAEGDRAALARERDEAREAAARFDDLQERSTRIRTRVEDAGREHRLEKALAEHASAMEALQDRFDETLAAEAGAFLLDLVEGEHRSEHQPETLRDARERFGRFTRHAWDLELDDERGLVARDRAQGMRRSLGELSSGTRMQLRLAVRLAWTRQIERDRASLPIFLDEALTTTDAERFDAVAGALAQLARDEGRQVFYLSARPEEIAWWERATGEHPHHVDLTAVRSGEAASAEALRLPERETLPKPDGRDAEAYAAMLGVPPLDPRGPEGDLHVFHLLRDDLDRLHGLMEHWRIPTLGQLEGLLGDPAAHVAIGDDGLRMRLAERCAAARCWLEVWHRGRGRPVDRIALEASGAVTETFLDRVARVAEALRGDGARLIEALRDGEVAQFRSRNIDELERWLHDEGYVDPAEPLDAAGRERETLLRAARSAPPEEVRRVVAWLEAAWSALASTGDLPAPDEEPTE